MNLDVEGYAAVPNALVRDTNVPAYAKLVYMVLSSHTGARGAWEMSHTTIADEAGISVASVKRALTCLRDLGILTWVTPPRQKPGEPARGCTYYVTPWSSLERAPLGLTDLPPRSEEPKEPDPQLSQIPRVGISQTYKEEPPRRTTTSSDPVGQELPIADLPAANVYSLQPKSTDSRFDEFWALYPRREKKAEAKRAWVKAVKSTQPDVILAGLQARIQRSPFKDGFVPLPPSWLNGERWTDEITGTTTASTDALWETTTPLPTVRNLWDQPLTPEEIAERRAMREASGIRLPGDRKAR